MAPIVNFLSMLLMIISSIKEYLQFIQDRENVGVIRWKQRTLAVIWDRFAISQGPIESENGLRNLEILPVRIM